jgi:hypothetical protein
MEARRMKLVLCCSILFIAGTLYSVAFVDKLANVFGWDDAWIASSVLSAVGSIWLGRRWFAKQSEIAQRPDA